MSRVAKNILVIEDEASLLNVVQKKLELNGFSMSAAKSVEEAFDCLKKTQTVDLIWLDHYLLGPETGLDFVKKIKNSRKEWEDIPIFVVATIMSEEEIQDYLKLGINRYFIKANSSLGEIVDAIKNFLKGRNKTEKQNL